MMASAGQGGAGLRGDQYYPPPPPPPRFPPPFPSPRHPYALAPSFLLLPSTTVAVSTLQPSTFSPFSTAVPLSPPRPSRRLPSYESNCSAGETRLGYARFLPTLCVHVCVCVCVCLCESAHGACICGPLEREGLFIAIGGTKRFVDRELCTMLFFCWVSRGDVFVNGMHDRCICHDVFHFFLELEGFFRFDSSLTGKLVRFIGIGW